MHSSHFLIALQYTTYNATVRREGAYVSSCAGEIDLNSELAAPVEKEISAHWQSAMDSALCQYIVEAEGQILAVCGSLDKSIVAGLIGAGLDAQRLSAMATTASRNCSTTVKNTFRAIRESASSMQRDLNRSLLPQIRERMSQAYGEARSVPGGSGKFARMKDVMYQKSNSLVQTLFSETTTNLLRSIEELVQKLSSMIYDTVRAICQSLTTVYSVCWEDQADKNALIDIDIQQKIRACRDAVLPDLNQLRKLQDESMGILGIEREELDIDVMAVDTLDQQLEKKMQAAVNTGAMIDLTMDSDDDEGDDCKKPAAQQSSLESIKVKSEKRLSV